MAQPPSSGTPARDDARKLELPPRIVPSAKAALTRMRSLAWRATGGEEAGSPGLRILFYHRVSDDPDPLAVRPDAFRKQMRFLAHGGWRVVDVGTSARLLATAKPSEAPGGHGRVIGLSFDDGYRDIANAALPELRRHGFSASVFVVPGVVDGEARLAWYGRQPPLLSWSEISTLADEGVFRFGAHTMTHPNLTALCDNEAEAEITGSKVALEARLGHEVSEFCYPAGLVSARERALVERARFAVAVTCEPGANQPGADLLTLRRVAVERHDNLLDFRAKLFGAHDAPLPFRSAYRLLRFGMS